MINACVSHEMRNPLNSIVAQNIEKKHLYIKLENTLLMLSEELSYGTREAKLVERCLKVVSKLNYGLEV